MQKGKKRISTKPSASLLTIASSFFMAHTQVEGHSGEYGNDAKLVWKMSKSVMQLISIGFLNVF